MKRSQEPRPAALPAEVEPYRTIGPFDETSLPGGLRQTHSLKDGSWAKLQLTTGELTFAWQDEHGGSEVLHAPAVLIVPPLIPHLVELAGPVSLTITFYRKT